MQMKGGGGGSGGIHRGILKGKGGAAIKTSSAGVVKGFVRKTSPKENGGGRCCGHCKLWGGESTNYRSMGKKR